MKLENGTNWITWVNRIAIFLVSLLAIGAFALSYNALYGVASSHGIPGKLAYIWPLLIDGAIVVFSISVVRASLLREKAWWPWALVIVFTAGTVFFNILHFVPVNYPLVVSIAIAIIAPVGLVLAFETVMGMLKSNVARKEAVQSIAQIEAEAREKRAELDKLQHDWREGFAEESRKATLELDNQLGQLQGWIEEARLEKATLQAEVDKARQRLNDITQQVEEKRRELNATQDATLVNIWDLVNHIEVTTLDTQKRQFFVSLLANAKVPQRDIAEWAGKSIKTIQRDITECNGLIKKAG